MNNFFDQVKKNAKRWAKKAADFFIIIIRDPRWYLRLSLNEQLFFIKQLSVLMRAQIPLLESVNMLARQSKSKAMKTITGALCADIENGQSLSRALGKFRAIFGDLVIGIIGVGELSGNLNNNLQYLARSLQKKQALRRKIIGAAVYPVFIITATIIITAMLLAFVFPKIIPIFKSVHYQLPWTTRFLIFISTIIKSDSILLLCCLISVIVGAWRLLKVPKVRAWRDIMLVVTPFLKTITVDYNISAMCWTLSLLLQSGIPIGEAFSITSKTTTNVVYKTELQIIGEALVKGATISSCMMNNNKLFPVMMAQMIAVGETTGNISETFSYLATMYEESIDELTKNVSTTIEPALLMFMGLLVGFIAISIITPIYGITQSLTPR